MKRDVVCTPLRKLTNEKLVTLLTLCLGLSMPATARAQAGQLDKSFGKNGIFNGLNTPPLASSQAAALTIQSDGKILITGQFQAPNGVIQPCVVRLTSGGTLDNSFGQLARLGDRVAVERADSAAGQPLQRERKRGHDLRYSGPHRQPGTGVASAGTKRWQNCGGGCSHEQSHPGTAPEYDQHHGLRGNPLQRERDAR